MDAYTSINSIRGVISSTFLPWFHKVKQQRIGDPIPDFIRIRRLELGNPEGIKIFHSIRITSYFPLGQVRQERQKRRLTGSSGNYNAIVITPFDESTVFHSCKCRRNILLELEDDISVQGI